MTDYFYDENKVRYQLVESHEGKPYNWLFFPGGPGANSSYLDSLKNQIKLPGNSWMIDLPGNGDNTNHIQKDYNFDEWLNIFVPIIKRFENPILIGHSFGGMFPLLFPELEQNLKGFVILHSAPKLWLEDAAEYAKQFSLPDLTDDMTEFTLNPNQQSFETALNACMPYYFPEKTLEQGRALLKDVPFSFEPAVWWQRKAIEINFSAVWIPKNVPTLIVGSKYDCICPYLLFEKDERFKRKNIEFLYIPDAGHLSWIENPKMIQEGFKKFCLQL
jgi:pimeloyl-ACP methyl ester carboxylesterase